MSMAAPRIFTKSDLMTVFGAVAIMLGAWLVKGVVR